MTANIPWTVVSSSNFDSFRRETEQLATDGFSPLGPCQVSMLPNGTLNYTITLHRGTNVEVSQGTTHQQGRAMGYSHS